MSFENTNTSTRNDALIPNTQIESMFLRICSDDEMSKYTKLIDAGHVSLATAYASNKVYKTFYFLVDYYERQGGNIEFLNDLLSREKARPNGKAK